MQMRPRPDTTDVSRRAARRRFRLRSAVGALTALLLLAAAPVAAQQPDEAQPRDTAEDPFAGPSVFDEAPERGVTVSRLTLDETEAPALVSPSDFYRVSFLADWSELRPRGVTLRLLRTNPLGLDIPPTVRGGDRVVVSLGGLGAEPGDVLQAIRRGRTLPGGRRVVHSLALLEVLSVDGDSARARVRTIFADYQVGDPVIPAERFEGRELRALEPAEETVVARLIGLETRQALVGTNDRVFLDAGSDAGLSTGDELMVFAEGTAEPAAADPEDRLGVLRLVRVRPETSTARVVETRDVGMRRGSPAVLVRRAVAGDR